MFLVAGYLIVWAAFGLPVLAAQQALMVAASDGSMVARSLPYAVAAVLGLAGLYQFTPLKEACLRQCRSPLDFLMQRWHGGGPSLPCDWVANMAPTASAAAGASWPYW